VAEIRYVILSDLHFGAQNSLMTSVTEGRDGPDGSFQVDPDAPSSVLTATLDGIYHLTAGQHQPPTLILAGDVLDLALSPDAVADTAFETLVDYAFGGADRLFGNVVYYLPGNHDHHLWEGTREAQYVSYLRGLAPERPIEEPWHTTRLRPESQQPVVSDLMSTLIQRRPGCADVTVQVAYPNLALLSEDGGRCRIVSHGHFTEPIYTLMSQLQQVLFPDQGLGRRSASIATLEAENFAWIDFFWSTLGRSGDVGADVGLIYADLGSPADLDILAGNLVRGVLQKTHGPAWLRPVETALATRLARREVRHLAKSERGTPNLTLSPKSRLGLRDYLEGPVFQQIRDELGRVPDDVGFVFGHTHKPFVEEWSLEGYPGPVKIYNTGGWVVDSAAPALTQGGVAVLLDEDLNAASLQFYRQTSEGGAAPVELLAADGDSSPPNPLHAALASSVDPADKPWAAISAAAADLIGQRHRLQATVEQAGFNNKQRRSHA
jgi:UDP-2,3-diacylglucosamine pyrophosphatase LpxH